MKDQQAVQQFQRTAFQGTQLRQNRRTARGVQEHPRELEPRASAPHPDLRAIEWEKLVEQTIASKQERLKTASDQLRRLEPEWPSANLTSIPTPPLQTVAEQLRRRTYRDSGIPLFSADLQLSRDDDTRPPSTIGMRNSRNHTNFGHFWTDFRDAPPHGRPQRPPRRIEKREIMVILGSIQGHQRSTINDQPLLDRFAGFQPFPEERAGIPLHRKNSASSGWQALYWSGGGDNPTLSRVRLICDFKRPSLGFPEGPGSCTSGVSLRT